MRFNLRASALACSAAFASISVHASTHEAASYNGSYVVEVLPNTTLAHPNPSCMSFSIEHGVRAHRWDYDGLCGLGVSNTYPDMELEAVWDIKPVSHSDGRRAYVIRSRVNNECLIRGNNGHDPTPTLYMWDDINPQWCGWNSPDALIENGQAAWIFGETPVDGEQLVAGMSVLRHGPAYLSFATIDTGLRAGQALVVIDHVFRFTRVPEPCAGNGAVGTNQIVRVCGVGEFSQPVLAQHAAYLQLDFAPWSERATGGVDYGDGTYYSAFYPADAATYCRRLRTGNFSDWRMPTLVELRGLYAAFPDNRLRQFGWTTGYRGHQTRDRFHAGGRWYFRSLHLFDGSVTDEWEGEPYPISCIR